MTTIRATGTSKIHNRAERATITARISVQTRSRSSSIAEATTSHNKIVEMAKKLRDSGDATWHSATPIDTWAVKTYA